VSSRLVSPPFTFYGTTTKQLTFLDIDVHRGHSYHQDILAARWPLFTDLEALKVACVRFYPVINEEPTDYFPDEMHPDWQYTTQIGLFHDLAKNHSRIQEGDFAGFPYEINDKVWEVLKSKIHIVPTDEDGNYHTFGSIRILNLKLIFVERYSTARHKRPTRNTVDAGYGSSSPEAAPRYLNKSNNAQETVPDLRPLLKPNYNGFGKLDDTPYYASSCASSSPATVIRRGDS
jgi:hypothetical protein